MKAVVLGEGENSKLFKNYSSFIKKFDTVNVNNLFKINLCVITGPKIYIEGFDYKKYIKTCMKNVNASIYILNMNIPIGTTNYFSKDYKVIHLSIQKNSVETSLQNFIFVYGGDKTTCNEVNTFMQREADKNIEFFITDSKTSELTSYMNSAQSSNNIGLRNDFFNISEENGIDFNILHKLFEKIQINTLSLQIISDERRGYSNKNMESDLDYLICLMSENKIHTFNIDGNIRSNIFNKRRLKDDNIEKDFSEKILFYNVDEKYGFLSNFSDHPIYCNNTIWKTVEHFFQAQKFIGNSLEEKIRLSYTPSKAKDIAKLNKSFRVNNWDNIKDNIMYQALFAKFTQHPDLKRMLLNTNNKKLYEHSSSDFYWADGGDGSGKNMLGQLLMRVRNELQLIKN